MAEGGEQVPLNNLNGEQVTQDIPRNNDNRRWFSREAIVRHKIPICIGLFVIFCAIGIIIYFNVFSGSDINICQSHECNDTAEYIIKNMNQSVNPCDNFYDFACGRAKTTNYSSLISNLVERLVTLIDGISEESPEYLKKLKRYYKSCTIEKTSDDVVKEKFGTICAWPILNKDKLSDESELDWMKIVSKLFKIGVPAHYFLTVTFDVDSRNNSKFILRLEQPDFSVGRRYLINNFNTNKLRNLVAKTFRLIGTSGNITDEVEETLQFELDLAKISEQDDTEATNTTVGDLEIKYPKIKWLDYLNGILSPYAKIDASEKIYIVAPFIDQFYDLMTNRKPSNRILANYALWRSLHTIQEYIGSTEIQCALILNNYMYLATSALYVQNNDLNPEILAIRGMSENIREKFYQILQNNNWLTKEMKNKISRKISKMEILIGYPNELLDNTKLDSYYQDLEISSDIFFLNTLSYNRFEFEKKIKNLQKPHNKTDWTGEYGHVIGTVPNYGINNVIHVPGGVTDSAFFYRNIPHYSNYATMGFIVGHEMSHFVSQRVRFFDEYGNLKDDWWDFTSNKNYLNKTECIVEKYNNYTYQEFQLSVNGTLTLDENLADINGLKIAYDAYIDYIKDKPKELFLPGLENYTSKQMFWITFGTNWCLEDESLEIVQIELLNEHSPKRYRVIGAVTSLKEFANDFHCQPTDAMSPPEKCSVWF